LDKKYKKLSTVSYIHCTSDITKFVRQGSTRSWQPGNLVFRKKNGPNWRDILQRK